MYRPNSRSEPVVYPMNMLFEGGPIAGKTHDCMVSSGWGRPPNPTEFRWSACSEARSLGMNGIYVPTDPKREVDGRWVMEWRTRQ